MRAVAVALMVALGGVGAASGSAQAAPSAPQHDAVAPGGSPNIIEIAGGCGRGWHPVRYRNRYGEWRTRCVRNYY